MNCNKANAGLFCKLSNAIITDLEIDSSCSFQGKGDYVGALSAEADGD